jgi:hypothetical protein
LTDSIALCSKISVLVPTSIWFSRLFSEADTGESCRRLAPGHSAQSPIPLADSARHPDARGFFPAPPPIVSHVADLADIQLVKAWIDGLPQ